MTAFQLRKHLAVDHGLELRGLGYAALVLIHQDDHRGEEDIGHTHEAGHIGGDLTQLLYLVVLILFILILLRILGIQI